MQPLAPIIHKLTQPAQGRLFPFGFYSTVAKERSLWFI